MTLNLKVHKTQDGRKFVCVTDSDLLGKKFEEGIKFLDFTTAYFKGEEKDPELIEKHIMSCYMATLSGKAAIALGKKMEVIDESTLLVVQGVPQAQVLIG